MRRYYLNADIRTKMEKLIAHYNAVDSRLSGGGDGQFIETGPARESVGEVIDATSVPSCLSLLRLVPWWRSQLEGVFQKQKLEPKLPTNTHQIRDFLLCDNGCELVGRASNQACRYHGHSAGCM